MKSLTEILKENNVEVDETGVMIRNDFTCDCHPNTVCMHRVNNQNVYLPAGTAMGEAALKLIKALDEYVNQLDENN